MSTYPLLMEPVLLPKIWGGRNLERVFGRALPPGEKIGESWEVTDLPQGVSTVAAGPDAGRSLHDLVEAWGPRLVGPVPLVEGRFPLLIKFLDAEDVLSVQVHPDEAACRQLGGDARVKHEAWYVIETRGDAAIYAGLKIGATREAFQAAVTDGAVERTLQRIPVKAGDCYYLPSGTVHALGAGVLVAEVQTPSDTTYRVFDWNRLGDDGKPRKLHVQEAITCIHFGEAPPTQQPRRHEADAWTTTTRLAACPRFVMDKVHAVEGFEKKLDVDQMLIWMILEGQCRLTTTGLTEPVLLKGGQTVILPAELDETVFAAESDCTWVQAAIPT
ncbi:MAG: class I mannose-6-phosphate isomerase [Phycisphaerae bacterium]|nr:class I mannose-6-phosphate isomerase [Phycisphaerae bacterium]